MCLIFAWSRTFPERPLPWRKSFRRMRKISPDRALVYSPGLHDTTLGIQHPPTLRRQDAGANAAGCRQHENCSDYCSRHSYIHVIRAERELCCPREPLLVHSVSCEDVACNFGTTFLPRPLSDKIYSLWQKMIGKAGSINGKLVSLMTQGRHILTQANTGLRYLVVCFVGASIAAQHFLQTR